TPCPPRPPSPPKQYYGSDCAPIVSISIVYNTIRPPMLRNSATSGMAVGLGTGTMEVLPRPERDLPIVFGSRAWIFTLMLALSAVARAQTTGATFGDVAPLGGTPSDIVLDELRGRIYLVINTSNRIDVYDTNQKRVTGSIQVGVTPLAAAMSMDSGWLY